MRVAMDWRGARWARAARSRWAGYLLLVAIVAVATGALSAQYAQWMGGYVTDDAYITFRYAHNLADGLGPVWTPGEDPVEGYTNFLWMLLVAGAIKLGIEPLDASQALGLAATAGIFALVPLLAAQLRAAWSWRWWVTVAGVSLALALNSGLSIWTFGGLETTGQALLVLAAITVHLWEERTDGRRLWSGPLFVAAALMRPDAVVFWGLAALHKGTRLLGGDRRQRLPGLALWGASFLLPFGAFWLWRWSYYGYFFPNTYYVKTERSLEFFRRGWTYASNFLVIYWGWLALAALASLWRERATAYRPATFLFVTAVVWLLYVAYSGGDWMPYFRFFVPALPIIYVLAVHGAIDIADWTVEREKRLRPFALGGLALVVAVVAFSAVRPHDSVTAKRPNRELPTMGSELPGAVATTEPRSIGLWLRETFPRDTTVAQVATGIVPYYSRLPTIDMLGVNDEHIAHLDIPLGQGPAGHEKIDGAYVISRQPEIIWLMLGVEGEPRTETAHYMPPYWGRGWELADQILLNGYVWDLYEPLSVPYEGGGYLNLLVHESLELPPEDQLLIPVAHGD